MCRGDNADWELVDLLPAAPQVCAISSGAGCSLKGHDSMMSRQLTLLPLLLGAMSCPTALIKAAIAAGSQPWIAKPKMPSGLLLQ